MIKERELSPNWYIVQITVRVTTIRPENPFKLTWLACRRKLNAGEIALSGACPMIMIHSGF